MEERGRMSCVSLPNEKQVRVFKWSKSVSKLVMILGKERGCV